MVKNIVLNVLYNLAILIFGIIVYWGFNNEQYAISAASLFALALTVFFKLRLIKEVKEFSKKRR